VDKPFYRTDDIHGMADFIAGYSGVDAHRLGALGICGDGGYTLKAQTWPRPTSASRPLPP